MNVPRNVLWFEVLLYLSLTLDAVSVAFQDRTPPAKMTAQMINTGTLMAAGLILLLVYFVWLAAERRKNWPRWVLAAALVLSVISLVQVIGEKGMQFDSGIEVISCALTAMGLYSPSPATRWGGSTRDREACAGWARRTSRRGTQRARHCLP